MPRKRTHLKAVFSDQEYRQIRHASMRGQLNSAESIVQDDRSKEVTFVTQAPKKLCAELERVVDFGASTAYDVLVS